MSLTALEQIADHATTSWKARENHNKDTPMRSYREGETAAYNVSHYIMTAELNRLRNLFQNNMLTMNDFTTS